MQSFSKVSAEQTGRGAYGQFRRRWLHGSLRQASIATLPMMMEGNVTGEVLLESESDVLKPVDLQLNHLDSPSISVSSPSPSTPIFDRPGLSATIIATTTNVHLPLGPFVSPLFSPLTPTTTPRSPGPCLENHSTGYWLKDVRTQLSKPGLLELDFSFYPISPRFPPSGTIPSPFRMQLQEDVATTPLPSGTPLTARWPGAGFQRSALNQEQRHVEAIYTGWSQFAHNK